MPGENISREFTAAARDRRNNHRFPLRLAVKYRSLGSSNVADWTLGESVNISSAGLLFTTPEPVLAGQTVEAIIAWPVFLDNRVPLKLVIKGSILRSWGDHTAMRFETYEFRTCQTPSGTTSRGL